MTFEKPDDIRYVDMCMYIDENIYNQNFDEDTIYKYLYFIIHMLASKQNILKPKYLDSFALFAASKVYFRLTNKDQFITTSSGQYKLKRVKSVLNYIKSSLYFLKVDFEQSEYYQQFNNYNTETYPLYNFENIIDTALSGVDLIEFELVMNDVGKTCERFLKKIPYQTDKILWHNIYVSVLLTFLNMITLTYKQKKRFKELSDTNNIKQYHIDNFYRSESLKPVLYGVPDSMSSYIIVLARRVRRLVGKDLSEILHTKVENDLSSLIISNEVFATEQGNLYEN